MKKLLVSIFVVFSLLLTPVAHAVGVVGDGCHSEDAAKKENSQNQNDGKQVNVVHHCCCAPASFKTDAIAHVYSPTTSKSFTAITDDTITSVAVDPLLEPPSHV